MLTFITGEKEILNVPHESGQERRLRELRHAIGKPYKAEALQILKEQAIIKQKGYDLRNPAKRQAVCEYVYGAPLADIPDSDGTFLVARAALLGDMKALETVNADLANLDRAIEKRAVELLESFARKHAPQVAEELEKARAKLRADFEWHGTAGEEESTAAIRTLVQELDRYENGGKLNFGHHGPARDFAHWGITSE